MSDLPTLSLDRPSPSERPSPTGAASSTASSASDAPAHLDDALAIATGEKPADATAAPQFLEREEWITVWLTAHRMGGSIAGLATLEGAPERPGARDAAGAIYDSAAETPSLHWLIEPHSKWLQRAMLIGAFYVPLGRAAFAEVKVKRRPINRRLAPAEDAAPREPDELAAARAAQGAP